MVRLIDAAPARAHSFGVVAAAFGEAAYGQDVEALARLLGRAKEIEAEDALVALRSLLGLLAHKTGETPRAILEAEVANAPSDAVWRTVGGGADECTPFTPLRAGVVPGPAEGSPGLLRCLPAGVGRSALSPIGAGRPRRPHMRLLGADSVRDGLCPGNEGGAILPRLPGDSRR
jgi:hypothetical protein